MIVIVAPPDDSHAAAVERRLRHLGESVLRLEVGDFPGRALSVRLGETHKGRVEAASLELAGLAGGVDAVWYRRVGWPRPDARLSAEDRAFAFQETQAALLSLAEVVDARAFAVNPLRAALLTERGAGKLHQLEVAREIGLAIPRTLCTNDPDAARAFVAQALRSGPGAIYKPFLAPVREEAGYKKTVFTSRLDDAGLAALDGVRAAPCLFQELVPKAYEIRANVIGARVFATEIRSQDSARSAIDFRRDYAVEHRPHKLDPVVERRVRETVHELGLRFGCVDLVVTPEGEHVFLEVNQQGQWLWCEERTGQPLLASFCEFLRQQRDDYACQAGVHAPGLFPEL